MIEALDKKVAYIYRVNPQISRQIQRRRNVHAAKWLEFAWCATPAQARLEVIRLSREGESAP